MAVEPGFEERRMESPMAASEEFIATQELFRVILTVCRRVPSPPCPMGRSAYRTLPEGR